MKSHRNAAYAFVDRLGAALSDGHSVTVRGKVTKELTAQGFTLQKPLERCITLQGRGGSVAASIAETMWVLAGRSDVAFLKQYVPSAGNYSDDGRVWRAGYGPRLRDWNGIDQLAQVRELLLRDPHTRRAVAILFDPALDFADSLDVPCNNWLHFTIRDGVLDLAVAVRSNDLVWGFSAINTFEWSVLQELMASWVGVGVGRQHFYISSLHVYEHHFGRARQIVDAWSGSTCYEHGYSTVSYQGSWEDFPLHLERWFAVEEIVRTRPLEATAEIDKFPEPMLRAFLNVLCAYWASRAGAAGAVVDGLIEPLERTDLGYAARELTSRAGAGRWEQVGENSTIVNAAELKDAIVRLHRAKSAAYGDSWKRRGETVGVMANIARKVDRIENVSAGGPPGGESEFDTLVDLFVYLVKYQTFLADEDEELSSRLFGGAVQGTKSDGTEGFEYLLARMDPGPSESEDIFAPLVEGFARLHALVEHSSNEPGAARQQVPAQRRYEVTDELTRAALAAVGAWAGAHPRDAQAYVAQALGPEHYA